MSEFEGEAKNPLIPLVKMAVCEVTVAQSEYQILKYLESRGVFIDLGGDASSVLFQKHFLLMNALYQLRDECIGNASGYIYISALRIQFIPALDKTHCERQSDFDCANTDMDSVIDDKGKNEKLRVYYLNMKNLATSAAQIDSMLTDFWKKFTDWQGNTANGLLEKSLAELNLDRSASFTDVQKTYRLLVAKHHPDRGGDPTEFIKIRRAYEVISASYS